VTLNREVNEPQMFLYLKGGKCVSLKWLDIGQILFSAFIWTKMKSRSINIQRENETYIWPS